MKKVVIVITILLCYFSFSTTPIQAQGHLMKRANSLYEQFAYAQAIEVYSKILEKDKKNAEAAEKIAHCYRLTSNTRKAEFWYKKATRYNKNNNTLKFHYGQALMSNGKYGEAEKVFAQYTRIAPKDSRGWRFLESCQNIANLMQDSSMYQISRMAINSSESDFGPAFYQDGLVFASARFDRTQEQRSRWTGESFVDMYYTADRGGRWTNPNRLAGKTTTPYHEGPATFNQSGTLMYFTRNVSKGKAKKTGLVNLRIYEARMLHGEWTQERELPFNSDKYSVGHPALSPDGKTLYFASDMPGGSGGKDIYKSIYERGTWSRPRNLGKNVNTEGDEMFPFVHADGTVYYASDGLGGFGGLDVFATRFHNREWEVTNVGYPINSSKDDFGLILTDDKRTGFFASNRKGSRGDDLYMLSIHENKAAQMVAVNPLQPPIQQTSYDNSQQNYVTNYANTGPSRQEPYGNRVQAPIAKNTHETPNNIPAYDGSTTYDDPVYQPDAPSNAVVRPTATTQATQSYQEASGFGISMDMAKTKTAQPNSFAPTAPANDGSIPAYDATMAERGSMIAQPAPERKTNKLRKDIKLVLIGIVLDKETKNPIPGAAVELTDLITQEIQGFTTEADGNFYFKLQAEKNYSLSKLYKGQIEDSKVISTINKGETEILHAILEGTAELGYQNYPSNPSQQHVDRHPGPRMEIYESEDDKKRSNKIPFGGTNNYYEDPDDGLTFRIQIGTVASANAGNSDAYLQNALDKFKVDMEKGPSGMQRYMVGNFDKYTTAKSYRRVLQRRGYDDSFIAAYLNGYRLEMPVEKVLEMYGSE